MIAERALIACDLHRKDCRSMRQRELIAAMSELTAAIVGLTGAMLQPGEDEGEDADEPVAPLLYMDGSPRA